MAVTLVKDSARSRCGRRCEGRHPTDGALNIQEGDTMSFDVGRPEGATVSHLTPKTRADAPAQDTGAFAQVYDLAKVRRGAPPGALGGWGGGGRAAGGPRHPRGPGPTDRLIRPPGRGRGG